MIFSHYAAFRRARKASLASELEARRARCRYRPSGPKLDEKVDFLSTDYDD
jgi:hypothetical protein